MGRVISSTAEWQYCAHLTGRWIEVSGASSDDTDLSSGYSRRRRYPRGLLAAWCTACNPTVGPGRTAPVRSVGGAAVLRAV
jgi:hypothetical protein